MRFNSLILAVLWFLPVWGDASSDNLQGQGTIFIRQSAKDLKSYRAALLEQSEKLKAKGFSAYSLHRVLGNPKTFILTLKCSNLEKAVDFARSPEFMAAMDKAGAKIPMIWSGLDEQPRQFENKAKMSGGIVIARNEVRDYLFWLTCFKKESHNHPGRKYKNSDYSIHHLPGKPEVVIVTHEASDVSKAPLFMTSDAMNGEMEGTGVVGLEIWYGINVEEEVF